MQVPFGEELVHYAIGPASFAVPGVPAGIDALHCASDVSPGATCSNRRCGSRAPVSR